MCVAKTKALISCAVFAQLICAFVFAYAKIRFFNSRITYVTACQFIKKQTENLALNKRKYFLK